ncbi:MAG: alkaline shock response membrane anchor protein AmaP [Clostridia bacterium]|nr:alkaline shock response membrane anchor protein AmaP [Clostridia bacterium]
MKFIEKTSLIIFSDIVLVLSILACVLVFGWLDYDLVSNICQKAVTGEITSQIILGCSIVFILLAIKCIFFYSGDKEESFKQGVLLENENGKLLISEETLQNLVNSVAIGFEGAEDVKTRVALDKENNLQVFVNLIVKPTAVIKELSNNIQNKVKDTIKQATDLDVKEVNIKIKNIAPKTSENKGA